MGEKTKSFLAVLIGMIPVLAFIGVVAFFARQFYCYRTATCDSLLGVVKVTEQPADGFVDNPPSVQAEVAEAGTWETHPIVIDMVPRLREQFEVQPVLAAYFQYRNYFFWEWRDVMGGDNYWLLVYRWDGAEWVFVEFRCETCPENQ